MTIQIRPEAPADREAIWNIHQAAFGGSDEPTLVEALREGGFTAASLVAEKEGDVVGHVLFSRVAIKTKTESFGAMSLAPMAVLPSHQNQGIGSRLVEAGLGICRRSGHKIAVVLGHPAFYRRFGFSAELAKNLESPFGGGDAWMALELVPDALRDIKGRVVYSPPFRMFE